MTGKGWLKNRMKKLGKTITNFAGSFVLRASPTKIHNKSDKSIFLIPISYFRFATLPTGKSEVELALSTGKFQIRKRLAREIKKDEVASVDWWLYSPSFNGYPSRTKIIFLARDSTNLDKILKDLAEPSGYESLQRGKICDHTILCQKPDMYLKLEKDKVKVEHQDENKTQEEQANLLLKPDEETRATTLEDLAKEVEVLKFHMATLVEILEKLQVELDHESESNPSPATNKASSSTKK